MKKSKFRLYTAAMLLTLISTSCQKVIDLKLRNDTGKLVIEGNIINRRASSQVIKLSRNVPFTSTNAYPPVSGASVTVRDSLGAVYKFAEGPAGTYTTKNLSVVAGNTYTMKVTTNGSIYTASSKMPQLVGLDSITTQTETIGSNKNRKSVLVHFSDPAGVPNQYRFILTVNGVEVSRVFAFNDDFIDGRYVDLELFENEKDIKPGDTVTVEMQCIDKFVFTYWFSLMQQDNGPGGGVSPSNPPTNITPAVLGYFSAHTSSAKTIVVQ